MCKWLLLVMCAGAATTLAAPPQEPTGHEAVGRLVATGFWDDGVGRQEAPIWIGVKMAPVPDALAAHLGRGGLMVANVVRNSPADAAGLERYDVLVSLDGRAVESMRELVEAISAVGTERSAALVLIRGGQQRTVTIRPAARPDSPPTEFKYDEPLAADDVTRYFGHRLRRDPQGHWLFEPLGELKDLPDPLREMLEKDDSLWRNWLERWEEFGRGPRWFRLRPDPNEPDSHPFFAPDEADGDREVHISITVSGDEGTVTIERHPDGRIEVRRTDRDGQESSTTYQNAEELREKDADAYRLYRRHTGGYKQRRWFTLVPRWSDLQQRQEEWRRQLEDSLQKLREQTEQHREKSRQMIEEARRLGEKVREHVRRGGRDGLTWHRGLRVEVTPTGKVHVVITRDGQTEKHSFESVEDLRQRDPELYEKVREWLGELDNDNQERSQFPSLVCQTLA